MKKLIARTAKLHSETKKGRRFKGIAITYEHIPTDLDERNHGSIYAVININCNNPEAEEVANAIIDTFHGEFYENLNKPATTSFENALSKINEELADITHQGHIEWLNNLNAILAVLSNNVLHVTQAGKSEVYLYRGEKASHITQDLSGDSVNPLRTFINIASGELHEGDKIAVVTPGVFYHLSKDELKKYVSEFQPKVAISHLADLLEGTTTEMNPNAMLLIEAITPEAASNETLEEQPDEIWISESPKPVETAIDTALPFAKKVAKYLSIAWLTIKAFTEDKVLPFLSNTGNETKNLYNRLQEKRHQAKPAEVIIDTTEDILPKNNLNFSKDYDEELTLTKEDDEEIINPSVSTKNEIFIKEDHSAKRSKLDKINFTTIKKAGTDALSFSKKFTAKYTKDRKKVGVIALVLILVLSLGIFGLWRQRENAENLKLANASFIEAQSKYEIGKSALSSGNRSQGANNLNDAKKIAESLKDRKELKDKVASLIAEINTALDQAENILRPSSEQIADVKEIVGDNPFGPYVVTNNMYLINRENGSIAQVNLKNNETANVLDKPNIEGKVTTAAAVTARKVLVIITDAGNLYEFDTVDNVIKKQAISGELEKAVAVSSFSTNIYLLTEDGKVYKRLRTSTGYGKSTEYISDGNYIQNPIDMRIDSNIYVMNNEGSINQYLAGKKQNFAIYDLPSVINTAKSFFTNEDTEGLYIVNSSKNTIVKIDSNGKFISQFANDSFNNATGIYVNDETKSAFVIANGKVHKFSL